MIRINQVKLRVDHTAEQLRAKAAELLHVPVSEIREMQITRQSIDARRKPELYFIYSLLATVGNEETVLRKLRNPRFQKLVTQHQIQSETPITYSFPETGAKRQKNAPVIIGAGPAGLFCGYFLALHGYAPVLLERGRDVDARREDVERFWREGTLNQASNVQFGEGGAGTFSDGKLNTLVKDKSGRNREVLETLVKFGAPPAIVYEAKPHIGTDVLCGIVKRMRQEIIRLGGRVCFESQVTDIFLDNGRVRGVVVNGQKQISCEQLVLAIGHSARDTFSMLFDRQIPMEAKSFAVGLRVQHPQSMINKSQYGTEEGGILGAAPYKLAAKTDTGRGVYSFCMCPGGYVVNASSEEGRLAVNGMSYSGRDSGVANSAIIVSVTPADFGSDHPLAGIAFQRRLEEKAYALGKGKIPVQSYVHFKNRVRMENYEEPLLEKGGTTAASQSNLVPLCKGDYRWADVSGILPEECNRAFVEGMEAFDRQIRGFSRPDAILMGVESRTSSPVRICRDETMQSQIRGLYPCGEGAGYAGGITSAAMDGLRIAEAIAEEFSPDKL